jgi:CheY-like chemotaxis protein
MQKDYAQTIKNSGESLLIIINGILDFSKIEAGKFFLDSEPFDMAEASEEVIELLSAEAAAKNLELKLFYEPDARRRLVGDPGRVKQVMLNLISNALKFTETGSIRVRVEKMTVSGHPEGLKVSVTDTGIGIPADKQSVLFEKFSQSDNSTTRKYGGTGLGLAICRELVSMMSGEIGFKSEPGIGSVFWFTLAFWELGSEKEADESMISSEKPVEDGEFDLSVVNLLPETFRVLLVEDNAVNQKLAGKILERMGCSVDTATNGKEAVSMFADLPYNMIFMDCQMPEMDGYEATRKIRNIETAGNSSNGKQVPIIAITANAMRGDREKCLEEGMDDYIAKPVDARQIGRALERWRHHIQL